MDLLKSKTFYFNLITILLGTIQVVSNTYPLPPEVLTLILGIGNLVLRMMTQEPIQTVGGMRIK
jgi:hypothetical protein